MERAKGKGLFLSFEGVDGSGKSTQAHRLWERLRESGWQALLVQEPGSTPLGWALRSLLKGTESITPAAELALFAAARAELVERIIKPELGRGTTIVADRYMDSTAAYQGYGRGLSLEAIHRLNALVTQDIKPYRTFLMDLDPSAGLQRVGNPQLSLLSEGESPTPPGRADQEGQRRFEEEPLAFHRRVRQGYLALAKAEPERFIVLDASKPPQKLEEAIWAQFSSLAAGAPSHP